MTLRAVRGALLTVLPSLLAGCAVLESARQQARLGNELVQLADAVLATAASGEDIRVVLRRQLGTRTPRDRMVFIAGHRFLLGPATLDRVRSATRYPALVAQSVELAEQSCLAFSPDTPATGMRVQPGESGTIALTASADGVQFVNVGIQLDGGCIVAMHFEQASAEPGE